MESSAAGRDNNDRPHRAAKKQKTYHDGGSDNHSKNLKCTKCLVLKPRDEFSKKQQGEKLAETRKCKVCALFENRRGNKICRSCQVEKPIQKEHYAHPNDSKCIPCLTKERQELYEKLNTPMDSSADNDEPHRAAKKQKTHNDGSSDNNSEKLKCTKCLAFKPSNDFSKTQRRKSAETRKCKVCVMAFADINKSKKLKCTKCLVLKPRDDFSKKHRGEKSAETRKCKVCNMDCAVAFELAAKFKKNRGSRTCRSCRVEKPIQQEHYAHRQDSKCIPCLTKERQELYKRVNTAECVAECVSCLLKRPKEEFSDFQWSCHTKICLRCGDMDRDINPLEDACEKVEQERQDEYEQEGIGEALSIKKRTKGCVAYDFRGFLQELQDGEETDSPFRPFNHEKPCSSSLYGSYDIIFHAAHHDQGMYERTSRGTLVLQEASLDPEDEEGEEEHVFCGWVKIDPTTNDAACSGDVFSMNFNFIECPSSDADSEMQEAPNDTSWSAEISARLPDESVEDDESDYASILERRGLLKIFGERVDLPWLLQEDEDPGERYSLEEIKELVKRPECSTSWMSRRLPVSLVEHISEYAASWRPEPAFTINPGDLLLRIGSSWDDPFVSWLDDVYVNDDFYLIARKRPEA